jgi:hypothetical protein
VRHYLEQARLFLAYLDGRRVRLEHAAPKDLDAFMAERLRIYRKRHGRSPRRLVHWRAGHTSGVRRLLRGAQEQWPPPSSGDSDLQRFEAHLMQRGLTPDYVKICRSH